MKTANVINTVNTGKMGQNPAAGDSDGNEANYPYVIFKLAENKFAVNCKYVLSIEKSAETTEIANIPREVRGIAYYKNEAVNVFDLRKLFGYMSQTDYIRNVIDLPQRISEHEAYFENLKECAETGSHFKLTTDPRECKFGKWMYGNTKEYSAEIMLNLHRIEPMHDRFHKNAELIKSMTDEGRMSEAAEVLKETEKIRDDIVQKLSDLQNKLLGNINELMVVLQVKGGKAGIIIDNTENVEYISEIQELPPSVALNKYVKKMGIRKKDREIILILEPSDFA